MTRQLAAAPVVAGIDIGGTAIKGVLVGRDGSPFTRAERPTPVIDGANAVVDAVVDVTAELFRKGGPRTLPAGVGLVMPGIVDQVEGIARWSANIGWKELPIRRLVSERIGLPVALGHDVRAAGLAELRSGVARGRQEVLFVAIGTGIAAALITHGSVVHGAAGLAGEVGHVPVHPGGEPCTCGRRGCAEAYGSAAAVARRYTRLVASTGDTAVSAEDVFGRAAAGEPLARSIVDEAIDALTHTILGAVLLADPELVVLAGGMAAAGNALTEPITAALQAAVPWREAPPVVSSHLGADAGALGAALLGWEAVGADQFIGTDTLDGNALLGSEAVRQLGRCR